MSAADYLELGKTPIRDGAPGGESCRDDAEFETLQLEIRKLELPDGGQPDWAKAISLASTLLRTRSKDLLVAAWFTIALLQQEGYVGLAAGLGVLRDMVEQHWDVLFPELKRLKGRVGAIEWVYERGLREVERRTPKPSEREAIDQCLELLAALDDKLSDRIEGGGPSPGEWKRALERVKSEVAAPPPAAPAATSTSSASSSGGAAVSTSVASAAEVPQALNTVRSILRSASDALRVGEPTSPLVYRLPRIAAWMHLVALPPHQDGQTQIPAPQPAELVEKIESMLASGQYAGVLEQTESKIATAVFWLDLHRYAAQALEGMGPAYQGCVASVVEETGQLLRRFPALKDLRFREGAPLANAATQAWIKEKVLVGGGSEGASPTVSGVAPAGDEFEGLDAGLAEARGLAAQRRVGDALRLLDEGARAASGMRARARWRLEAARLCLAQNLAENAFNVLEGLDQEMAAASVEEWDRGLAIEVLKTLFQSHQKVISFLRPIPPEEIQRSRLLLGRLSRLDVVTALAFEPKR
ncbi:MAG: type VI secretion system protein TssA [Candidatus Eisenbacteria bacterium]